MPSTTRASGSLNTCHLKSAIDLLAQDVPESWSVGLFGSTRACPDDARHCIGRDGTRDLDLLLIYPSGRELQACNVRKRVRYSFSSVGLFVDIVLINRNEARSSGFWTLESVRDLRSYRDGCAALMGSSANSLE